MYTLFEQKEVVARKPHGCDWCCGLIEKGEKYEWSKYIFDGDFNEWHSHLSCSRIASAIWDYVDPGWDEGMSQDEYMEGCQDICQHFICPGCPEWDKEYQECNKDESYCLDKLDNLFRTHDLYLTRREGIGRVWELRERK